MYALRIVVLHAMMHGISQRFVIPCYCKENDLTYDVTVELSSVGLC